MDIERYEELTGKTVPEDQRSMIAARLSAAAAHINKECDGQFIVPDGIGGLAVQFPPDVEYGAVLLVKAMASTPGLASQSLAGMSKSFFEGAEYRSAAMYWKRYRKVKFF